MSPPLGQVDATEVVELCAAGASGITLWHSVRVSRGIDIGTGGAALEGALELNSVADKLETERKAVQAIKGTRPSAQEGLQSSCGPHAVGCWEGHLGVPADAVVHFTLVRHELVSDPVPIFKTSCMILCQRLLPDLCNSATAGA